MAITENMNTYLFSRLRVALVGSALAVIAAATPATAQNLLSNGSFEKTGVFVPSDASGQDWNNAYGHYENAGFTSDYKGRTNDLYPEGYYMIGGVGGKSINPAAHNHNLRSMTEDYDGTGAMMLVNGYTELGKAVWQSESFTATDGAIFAFSAQVTNINLRSSWGSDEAWRNAMPILQFEIELNGGGEWVAIGDLVDLTRSDIDPELWHEMGFSFTVDAGTEFRVRLTNQQDVPYGNDFALDGLDLRVAEAIPEPSTYALLGAAGAAAIFLRRQRVRS